MASGPTITATMDDAGIDGRFKLSNRDAVADRRWWDQAEPVWVTAERHDVRSATMFWPGSEAAIHGVRPTIAPRFGAIGRLLAGLASRHIDANLVIVSDHGMTPVSGKRLIRMDKLAPQGSYQEVVAGPYARINAVPGREAELAAALLKPHRHMQCWRKQDMPARLAYGGNPRVPAFVCLAEVGWSIVFNDERAAKVKGGAHGYDNLSSEMAATFIAAGPAFKPGVVLRSLDNVDVYPLLMRLIGVPALPSDGHITPLLPALRP